GCRGLHRSRLARLHRAVAGHRGAVRPRPRRVGRPDRALRFLRHAVTLHRGAARRRMRRAVVTGLGVMSPFGAGVKAYWAGLAGGACAIRPLSLFEATGFRCSIAGEVPEIAGGSRRRTRADRLGLIAACEALDDAGLETSERREAALVVGA